MKEKKERERKMDSSLRWNDKKEAGMTRKIETKTTKVIARNPEAITAILTNSRRKIMTHKITKTLRSGCLIIAFSLFVNGFINTANAQNCSTPPTCESLGYVLPEVKCRGVASLKCPFDTTKYYCSAPIMLGDILYSDKSFSSNLIASKTPIGVVFDVENRMAVSLNYSLKMNNVTGDDIPSQISGITDDDGKVNTKLVMDYVKKYNEAGPGEIHYPAIEYAYNYSTAGTSKGDWFLPSSKEASLLIANGSAVKSGFNNANKGENNLTAFFVYSLTSTVKGTTSEKIAGGTVIQMPNNTSLPAFPIIRF